MTRQTIGALAIAAAMASAAADVPAALHGRVVDIWTRVTAANAKGREGDRVCRMKAWRGERVHAQTVTWCDAPCGSVRFECSPMVMDGGGHAGQPQLSARVVRDVAGVPDLLDWPETAEIGEERFLASWLTAEVPRDARPGVYRGTFSVVAKGGRRIDYPVELSVKSATLPEKNPFFLDLWQNVCAVARWHNVKPYTKEHYAVLEPMMRELAAAGQKVITVPVCAYPWGKGYLRDEFVPMVKDVRYPDGRCELDFTVFDDYVEFARRCGVGPQIHCYTILKFLHRYDYFYIDGATGEERVVKLDPDTPEWKAFTRPFLEKFEAHVRDKGWIEDVYIAIDEGDPPDQFTTRAFLKEVAPSLKYASASNKDARLFKGLDAAVFSQILWKDYCNEEFLATLPERRARGQITTFYVCTQPQKPNTWFASPLVETEWLGLYAAAKGFDGFLRWSVFHWTENPFTTAKEKWCPEGELHLLYPNARASMRWEILRDSIEDYRKIAVLRDADGSLRPAMKSALDAIDFEAAKTDDEAAYRAKVGAVLDAVDKAADEVAARTSPEISPPHVEASRLTFANPIDLEYRMRPEASMNFREGADPDVVLWNDRYWLFASKCGGYYVSDDMVSWKLVRTDDLPLEEYAPTAWVMNGNLYFSSRGGTVHRAVDAAAGRWEKLKERVPFTVDSKIHFENGRLFNCYGGTTNKIPLWVCELDASTFRRKGDLFPVAEMDDSRFGWDVRGDNNELTTGRLGCKEGAHLVKRGDVYYFQYATPGTEYMTYCDVALVGNSPLGPFRRQKLNPFCIKPGGYAKGAGHGCTIRDRYGNWWHITTCVVSGVNRRIVVLPVFFDHDGEMWCDTAFADWPIVVPGRKSSNPADYHSGWMPLTYAKHVEVSSTASDSRKDALVDENMRTIWSAATGNAGEWAAVDFGGVAEVRAVQIGFAEAGNVDPWRNEGAARRWKVEVTQDGSSWACVVDESNAGSAPDHPYRVLKTPVKATKMRVVCVGLPPGNRFALREIRAFGQMDVPKPSAVSSFSAERNKSDRRRTRLSWSEVKGADGYVVRYGPSPDKMHLSRLVRGAHDVEIRSLNTEQEYFWSIEAFNAAGLSPTRK